MAVLDLLRDNPHFSSLPANVLELLANAFSVASHPEKHVLFHAGDRNDPLYMVVRGEVAITRKERKRVHVLRRLGPGSLFGMTSVLLDARARATATTLVPSEIAELHRVPASLLFNQSAPLAYAFQKALAVQLAGDLRATDLRLRDVIARLPPQL